MEIECSICLNVLHNNNIMLSCCKNKFCNECIKTWFYKKKQCPLCKNENYKMIKNYIEIENKIIEKDLFYKSIINKEINIVFDDDFYGFKNNIYYINPNKIIKYETTKLYTDRYYNLLILLNDNNFNNFLNELTYIRNKNKLNENNFYNEIKIKNTIKNKIIKQYILLNDIDEKDFYYKNVIIYFINEYYILKNNNFLINKTFIDLINDYLITIIKSNENIIFFEKNNYK